MSFEEHLTEFAGMPVVLFPNNPDDPLPEPDEPDQPFAWRLDAAPAWDGEEEFDEVFLSFLERVDTSRVRALVIGAWSYDHSEGTPVDLIVEAAPRFPELRALFLGDIVREQSDVAYITHPDLTPILAAYPALEEFWVRGSADWDPESRLQNSLIQPVKHGALRVLCFQSGGLSGTTMRTVGECDLPALEHLEFYFGDADYGGDGTLDDIAWLLSGVRFPALRHLGLRDSPSQDEIAEAVAHAPIVAQLDVLDLSLGTLGDEGVSALLAGQPLTHLKKLDLHHHFLSEPMAERVRDALPGVEVDLSELQTPQLWYTSDSERDERRYIAVAE